MVGPVIQDSLFAILLRFRKHKYVLSSDVTKMYRQVFVQSDQRNLQRIVWRENSSDQLHHYSLNTVTYGTAAASFLAIRSLQQLGHDSADQYPRTSSIIMNDFYVDDLLTGANSVEEAISIREEITKILEWGCFELRKWVSNEPQILEGISNTSQSTILHLGENENTKTLGLVWLPKCDSVSYNINVNTSLTTVTKRSILSSIAKIYDPLGLLAASLIIPKIILQQLWQYKLSWDESIPIDLHTQWLRFQNEMNNLRKIKISRHVLISDAITVEIHGYCDSSETAYGACAYMRSTDIAGNICVRLLCAKSKVAPVKIVSIPRLELCGALLLARLVSKIESALTMNINRVSYWCDSTVTLAWIKTPPNTLKIFVANRVAEIQDLTSEEQWFHVRSGDNPADLLSRGISPLNLIDSQLWWCGPTWLSQSSDKWPSASATEFENSSYDLEKRQQIVSLATTVKCKFEMFERFSNLSRLQRCVAYCLRFKTNALRPAVSRKFNALSVEELNNSLHILIKTAQSEVFAQDIADLRKHKSINTKSKLLPLSPFLDEEGLLRVGGRLQNSTFTRNKKHPCLLPQKHKLTFLIVKHEHLKTLHAGPQALLASVRENYWPISGRNIVKKVVHDCVTCFRAKPKVTGHLMGSLPKDRVTPCAPFSICGVDFCGPILIKDRRGRGCKTTKAYICLFICFAVKASHLELVSDLTTDAFLAALRRFVSRRGKPSKIYSDNATNFVGADTDLKNFLERLNCQPTKDQFENSVNAEGISWHFIPPRSPHFGGLWEAGVKSVKFHLKRVVKNALLTYEELYTILTQIEAMINSRPMYPMSSDPNDFCPLTPGHFLIGRSLLAAPDQNVSDVQENRLSRFQRVQQIAQHFWNRWSREYLSELQKKTKWRENHPSLLQIGSMVLVSEEKVPPLKWRLGRVTGVHPGPDGIIRVVTVKCGNSEFKRAVRKICALPIEGQ